MANDGERRTRRTNQAKYLTFFADGTATLTCGRHMTMALRAGGFGFELDTNVLLVAENETAASIEAAMHVGHAAMGHTKYSRPIAPSMRGVQGGVPPGGAQPPGDVP